MEDDSAKPPGGDEPPAPHGLDYRAPEKGPRSGLALATAGFLAAAVSLGCGSALWYVQIFPIAGAAPPPVHRSWMPVAAFAAMALLGIATAIWTLRHQRGSAWGFFIAGFAIGASVTALIEGFCFAVG